jgi:hypothetical protein
VHADTDGRALIFRLLLLASSSENFSVYYVSGIAKLFLPRAFSSASDWSLQAKSPERSMKLNKSFDLAYTSLYDEKNALLTNTITASATVGYEIRLH